MTITEVIRSYPALEDIKLNLIVKVLADRDISDGTASYTSSVKEETELAAADLMVLVAISPEFSEGDLSIKYNPSALKAMAKTIYDDYNDPKADTMFVQPQVRNASNLW